MSLSLSFLGAAGSVTGSRFLLDNGEKKVLVDCGLFQGLKQLRDRNWARFPVEPHEVDAVLLTHAHLDHSGYLPAFVRDGFAGRIHCTSATADLCGILLPDSGFLQEKDAEFANKHGFSKHAPAKPLYTAADAEASLKHFSVVPFHTRQSIAAGPSIYLRRAGHILGAATIECDWAGVKIVFSGDVGRLNDPVMVTPEPIEEADFLVIESTYGNRKHDPQDPADALAEIVSRTAARGGTVVIPAFAVGRAQSVLYYLQQLAEAGRIPPVPVFIDSPMATDASNLVGKHIEDQRLSKAEWDKACSFGRYVKSVEESKALTINPVPKVIISASGMATGGRVLHHLKRYAPDRRNTILFAGYQAAGTRGADMMHGAPTVKIHGAEIPVRAEVANLSMLSAHADADEMLTWLRNFKRPPRTVFLAHGEPEAADALRRRIQNELGWQAKVPEYLEKVQLA